MYTYQFTGAAEKDMEAAYLWFEDKQDGLGIEFLDEIELACQYISKAPNRYPPHSKDRKKFLLKSFGSKFSAYLLIYRVKESTQTIVIIAVAHMSQSPNRWEDR